MTCLHSFLLPRAVSGASGPCTTCTGLCFAHRSSTDYQTPELWLVPDAKSRALPHPGRGSSGGWKEPLLYRLTPLWTSCLSRLPNLTSEKPGFTFYELGQLRKETRFPIRLYQTSLLVVRGLMQKPGPPVNVFCLQFLNVGQGGADQKVLAHPQVH